MTISESDRRDLFNNLEVTLGGSAADTLMQLLPYQPADQLVTRVDMHAQTALLHGEMAELRADLTSEMAELRSEIRGDMAQLRTDLTGDMSQLRSDVVGEVADLKVWVQRWVSGAAAVNLVALITALAT
ncbi:CCDC90 family protein [bacterium]|nr:CCDC90 family protein [bacterium]